MSTKSINSIIESGEPVFGGMSATHDPATIDVLGAIGLDFVWLDMEHVGQTAADGFALDRLARTAESADIAPIVRLPAGHLTMLETVLNAGIQNVIVADIETPAEVESIIRHTRFQLDGEPGTRGASFSRSNDWGAPPDDYVQLEDRSKTVGVMIENQSAIDHLEEIVAVPGLDFVRIGVGDISISLGHPYENDHPAVRDQIEYIEEVCLDAAMPLSKKLTDPSALPTALDRGYRVLTIGRDLTILRSVMTERLRAMRSGGATQG